MSQWGKSRIVRGHTYITDVDTGDVWRPIEASDGTVGLIILMNVQGDREEAERILVELQREYVGKPYADWLTKPFTSYETTVTLEG